MKKFIIKASRQITLPVTPESFEVSTGRRTETVNIHEVGDVNLPGGMSLGTIKVSCMFPNQGYPFALDYGDPYEYVEKIQKIIKKKNPVRFVVSDTDVNERVLIEEISYGERDGTGDVYATITMRGYRKVSAAQTATVEATAPAIKTAVLGASASRPRDSDKGEEPKNPYHAKKGQTFFEIAREVYGDGATPTVLRLAKYNGRSSLRLLLERDEEIQCPPLSDLEKNSYRDLRGTVDE